MKRVWGNQSYRVLAWGWLALQVGLALALIFTPGMSWWGAALIGLIFGVFGAVGWAVYGRTDLSLQDDVLTVRNPFRVIEIPAAAVREIEPDQRLTLHLRDGEVVQVWSVQAANISLLLDRRSHVDRVADELRQALAESPAVSDPPRVVQRLEIVQFAFWVVVAALGSGVLRFLVHS